MPRKPKSQMTPEELEQLKEYYRNYNKKRKETLSDEEILRRKEITKQRNKQYKETNKELLKNKRKVYISNNQDKIKESWDKYYSNNKETLLIKRKEWDKKNPDYKKTYKNNRRKTDSLYRLTENIRNLIRSSIKRKNLNKNTKSEQILGCTFEEFKQHLEGLFEPWMNWDNYGLYNGTEKYGWDIDHIIPVSSGLNEQEITALNHYTNLKPLCSKINRDVKRDN
jgi:hypothetical protein